MYTDRSLRPNRRNTFKFVGGELWHGTALQEKVNSTLERLSAMKGDFAQYCKFTVEARSRRAYHFVPSRAWARFGGRRMRAMRCCQCLWRGVRLRISVAST